MQAKMATRMKYLEENSREHTSIWLSSGEINHKAIISSDPPFYRQQLGWCFNDQFKLSIVTLKLNMFQD